MRSLFILIFPALLLCFSLSAQNVQLVSGEYFIGEDPGLGQAIPISFTPSDTTNLLFEIDSEDLEPGFYFLYMRFKDINGNWSLTQKTSFRVYEYVEQQLEAINITIFDVNDTLVESFVVSVDENLLDTIYHIPTIDLTPGRYKLIVGVLESVTGLEVQISNTFLVKHAESLSLNALILDAFQGQNVVYNILDSAISGDTLDMVLSFSVDSLPIGYFQLNSTLMSANSSVSFPYQRHTKGSLRKYHSNPQFIEKLEFFYNTDPGFGNGFIMDVDHIGDTLKLDTLLSSADLSLGVHQVFVRALADNGAWSHTFHVGQLEVISCNDILISYNITDVSCFEGEDGEIEVLSTVPELDYLIFIDGDTANQQTQGLSAGEYSIEIRSPGETCIFNDTLQLLEPDPFTAEIDSIANVSCPGGTNGSAIISIEGGVMPYNISWDNGQTGEILQNVSAGTYEVLVLDANDCPAVTEPVVITAPDSVSLDMATVEDVSCFGQADGAISATVSGGIGTLQYSWLLNNSPLTGATTTSIENLGPGNYVLIVSYSDGLCTETTATFTISQPDEIVLANVQTEDLLCFEDDNGSISVTISGGAAPYTYLWNDGGTTAVRENLPAGSYLLSVTDANDCVLETGPFSIDEPDLLEVEVSVTQEISCYLANDGIAVAAVTGGTGPYNYQWDNGASTSQITGISPGTYTVVVTDDNACTADSVVVNITEPDSLEIVVNTITDAACFDEATGGIEVQGSGGTGTYTFTWSNGANGNALTNVTAGLYSVTITDANNCSESVSDIEVMEPEALAAELIQVEEPLCNGLATGSIEVSASGGTGQLSYLWSNGLQTSFIENLPAGSYELTITDANDCTLQFGPVTIDQPDELTAEAEVSDETDELNDGSINLNIGGGTLPYEVNWGHGASGQSLTGLSPGIYTYTVNDANGCTLTGEVEISPYVSVTEAYFLKKWDLFPNPANNRIEVRVNEQLIHYRLEIMDALGRSLYSDEISERQTIIPVQHLAAGFYTIRIYGDQGVSTRQLIISR